MTFLDVLICLLKTSMNVAMTDSIIENLGVHFQRFNTKNERADKKKNIFNFIQYKSWVDCSFLSNNNWFIPNMLLILRAGSGTRKMS